MFPNNRSWLVALVGALFLAPATGRGQQAATVPRDLAEALARMYTADSSADIEFVGGQVPPAIQSAVHLPSSALLVGTIVVGRASYVFATSPQPADSVLAAIQREYGRAGWEGLAAIRLASGVNPALGGFRPAPPTTLTEFCHGDTDVTVTATRAGMGMTNIRLRVNTAARCVPRPGAIRVAPPAQLPLPRLIDPANSMANPSCFINGGGSQSTQTQLATALSPAALLDHYGRQMESQGWSPLVPDDPFARRVWSRRDSTGRTELATLRVGVTPTAPGCRDAVLDVTTLRTP